MNESECARRACNQPDHCRLNLCRRVCRETDTVEKIPSCSMSFSPYALPARIDGVVMNGRKKPGQLTHSYYLVVVVVVTLVCVCVWIDGLMDGRAPNLQMV